MILFVFFVLHLHTRRILLVQASFSPNSRWLKQQARHVLWECQDREIKARFFLHDNDACYSEGFDGLLKSAGLKPVKNPYQAPNANAFAERWIRSLREECLKHLVILGLNRLQYVLDEYKDFFNYHRPHQGIENRIPEQISHGARSKDETASNKYSQPGNIQCHQLLGGLLKSYFCKAA